MQVNVHTAKSQLSKLLKTVENGEEVVIARGDRPVARLVPVEPQKFRFGILAGQLGPGPDFFEPLPEGELRLWEGGD